MKLVRWPQPSPATRVSLGLVSLMISLVLLVDLFVGLLPDRVGAARQQRTQATYAIATAITQAFRAGGPSEMQTLLAASLRHDPQLIAGAVRSDSGELIAAVGDHVRLWRLGPDSPSTLENIRTPILASGQPWGELQLVFRPVYPQTWIAWLYDPLVKGFALIALLGFAAFNLYLRRVLSYLDPTAAVPERVRTAFDTLTEGVLVLDTAGKIMLANKAFRSLSPDETESLTGVSAAKLNWLTSGSQDEGRAQPWESVARDNQPALGYNFRIKSKNKGERQLVMNCSPIADSNGRVRGALATFADVTELHDRTEWLRIALDEVRAAQEEIQAKNEELTRLATRDSLTGCLNRRAFMADTDLRFAEAVNGGTEICCIMCDIDHFKQVNDRYGHAGGDHVIQGAAKALSRGIRTGDLLGRYGGEEFCLILPGASLEQTMEIAQRLRADVEANLGNALRQSPAVTITMSFGVAHLQGGVESPSALIDLADQALYHSKKNGRNRVTSWADMELVST